MKSIYTIVLSCFCFCLLVPIAQQHAERSVAGAHVRVSCKPSLSDAELAELEDLEDPSLDEITIAFLVQAPRINASLTRQDLRNQSAFSDSDTPRYIRVRHLII